MDWNEILQPAFQAIAVALGSVTVALITQLARKVNVDLSDARQKQIEQAAIGAVLAIEEQAARSAVQWASSEKTARAVDAVLSSVKGAKPDQARQAVDAALPVTGLGASGKPQPSR